MKHNCKCILKALPLPENYTGDLTIGTTNAVSETVNVYFRKPGGIFKLVQGTTNGAGELTATIPADVADFFSRRYANFKVIVQKTNGEPVNFVYNSENYDCMALPFIPKECGLEAAARTLQINTSNPCTTC